MATTIKLKNGSGAPGASDLVQGEPAIDLTNKRLYTEDSSGAVIEVGSNPSSLSIGGAAVTATPAELNILDGVTSTTAELNILDGVTSTAAELNILDGVTSTAAELNILDGVTSTAAELNILDGVTSTAAEINLVDGSAAGTVANSKAVIYGSSGEVNATTLQVGGVAITSTPAELNILDGVTSSAAELNILDGVTSTTAELNILDGVTSTASELNILDGVTSTAAELNILDGVTSTTAELNILDGVTSTTTELNILDGVTSTAVELNILDGVTSTTAELNILDGVTSTTAELNILAGKAFLDEDNMASDSATGIPSQQSVKAYVDSQSAAGTFAGLTDTNITSPADGALAFYDTGTSKWIDNVVSGDITIADTGVAAIGSGVIVNDDINSSAAISVSKTALVDGTGLTLTNDTLSVDASQAQITTVGTIGTGTWQGSVITNTYVADDLTINGGTIENTPIGAATPNTGAFTTANATTVDTTNLEVTNLKAKDGTSAGSIANSTGVVTLASSVLTTTDINGGTIDGATIGGTTAAAGTFTTFTSTGIDDNATSTAITIDDSENVGIGDGGTSRRLYVKSGQQIVQTIESAASNVYMSFVNATTIENRARIGVQGTDALVFRNAASDRMLIDSSGNLLVGKTSGASTIRTQFVGASSTSANSVMLLENSSLTDLFEVRCDGRIMTGTGAASPYNQTVSFSANVFVNNAGVLYRQSSSARYKENIQDMTFGLSELMSLRPVTFESKTENTGLKFGGFIAEEVHDTGLVEFVEYNDEGQPDAVGYANMVSLLTKAIQEQQAMIETLQAQVAAL